KASRLANGAACSPSAGPVRRGGGGAPRSTARGLPPRGDSGLLRHPGRSRGPQTAAAEPQPFPHTAPPPTHRPPRPRPPGRAARRGDEVGGALDRALEAGAGGWGLWLTPGLLFPAGPRELVPISDGVAWHAGFHSAASVAGLAAAASW